MLIELYLKNYILIQELRLHFEQGMSVLTGETGAGKSIIVGALNLVFGKTNSQQIAYDPQKDVNIEITFQIRESYLDVHRFLDEAGFPADNNEVIVSREFAVNGKSTSFLNGRKTSISVLKELHDLLVDFHHQRDQQNLLNQGFQLDLLDQFGGLIPLRNDFQRIFQELRASIKTLKDIQEAEEKDRNLIELYRFQLDEFSSVSLKSGEDSELEKEFELLSHSEDILNLASETYNSFYEQENSIFDSVSKALINIQKYIDISPEIKDISSKLETCLESIQDASVQLRAISEHIASDPERLNSIRQRLDTINNLKTKYKQTSIDDLLAYFRKIDLAVQSQNNRSEEIQVLANKIDTVFRSLIDKANVLSEKRNTFALKLAKDIKDNMKQLSIPNAQFEIRIDKKAQDKILLTDINSVFSDSGQDTIEFRFTANPDSPVLPLKSIVSGGELSRILLATKKSLSEVMPPRTMILDEIDSGIGGKTAGALADFIHSLSKDYQVICITHLAKIAAAADNHITIEKKSNKGITSLRVETLDSNKRVSEIARMLSGQITELSVQHATELLNNK